MLTRSFDKLAAEDKNAIAVAVLEVLLLVAGVTAYWVVSASN
jgi:hypothetical protein